MKKPVKPSATLEQHIKRLRSRGMQVDVPLARQWLENVSYYRLSAYWYPARLFEATGKRSDRYVEGTSFSHAVELYEADRKLRTLIHDGIERVEIATRTRLGELLCANDPLAYTNPTRFRPTFDHDRWMATAKKRVRRATKSNESIRHYLDVYDGQFPFWVLAEVLDFADVSRLYEGLPAQDQRHVAESFGIVVNLSKLSANQKRKLKLQSPLVRWLEQLTLLRNICAHHNRLWNTSFSPAPTNALQTHDAFALLPDGQSERVFGAIVVMTYLLQTTSPGTRWPSKVSELIRNAFLTSPLVTRASMGIPDNWTGSL